MNCVNLDTGSRDFYFDDIAFNVVGDGAECDLLEELAKANATIAKESQDPTEGTFALEASRRLAELSRWFRENAP